MPFSRGFERRLGATLRRYGAYAVGALFVAWTLLYIPTGYYLVSPGEVRGLRDAVKVKDAAPARGGDFYIVTVSTRKANAVAHAYGLLDPASRLRPKDQVIPPGTDERQYFEESRRMMRESQETAKVVALKKMGFDARLSGTGVRVVEVLPSSAAEGVLARDDVIVKVEDYPVSLADELLHEMRKYRPGQVLSVEVMRGGERVSLKVPTGHHPEDPQRAAMGVRIETHNWHAVVPIDVSVDTGSISGPSGGLMLTLEIMEQLSRGGSLLPVARVAGTGTIAPSGGVGPVGGVAQKVIAAERAGMQVFLVPNENLAEARGSARRIELVPVGSLDDAVAYLVRSGGTLRTGTH
ncbi:MAG: PDZ domain-containing protein [Firmicutes bacterium]|nr:PDZ domain-containing protein [Bacillota bacterium]